MANMCGGALAIECTDKEKLIKVQKAFENEGGVSTLSFEGLLDALDVKEDDRFSCDTRGEFYSPELKQMKGFYALVMDFNCKWSFDPEILNAIFKSHNDLTFEFIEEECGNGVFVNTDINGKYFVDRYYLYIENDDSYYFANGAEKEAIEALQELFPNATLKSINDCLLLNYAKKMAKGWDGTSTNEEKVLTICKQLFPNLSIKKYEECPVVNGPYFSFNVFEEE